MFKKILIVLMIGCFLLGMATKAEVEEIKEEAEKEVIEDSAAARDVDEKDVEPDFRISAAKVSNLAQGDTITNVIFGEAEMTVSKARTMGVEGLVQESSDEKVKVKYPKVVMVSDEDIIERSAEAIAKSIRFLDVNGKLKKEIPVQRYILGKQSPARISISKNEKFLAINTPIKEDEKGIWGKNTVVFNSDGDRLWGFDHNLVTIYLSPNGEYMVGQGWESGPVVVYGKDGKTLREIENNGLNDISFSDDGNYFAVILEGIDREMKTERYVDRAYADLVVVDAQGNELWRKEKIAKGSATGAEVKISNGNITVITGVGEYKVYHFDKDGKLLKTEQGDVGQLRNFKD